MRDNKGEKHEVPTIPPPAGESDIYEAKTQVGGLPPEALAMLRAIREESPSEGGEANVPVFEDDEAEKNSGRFKLVGPAAGAPAARSARPSLSQPTPAVGFAPTGVPLRDDGAPPASTTKPLGATLPSPSVPKPVASDPEVAPVFGLVSSEKLPPKPADADPVASSRGDVNEPVSYESVFAPLDSSTATGPRAAQPAPAAASNTLLYALGGATAVLLLALAAIVLSETGLLGGGRAGSASQPTPARSQGAPH